MLNTIPKEYYLKTLDIIDDLSCPTNDDFRRQVLSSFKKVFGFSQSNFWLCDENNNIFDPITFNVEQRVMKDYIVNYYQKGFLSPINIKQRIKVNVVNIFDIITKDKYETSLFYNNFLMKHDIYYILAMLLYNGNRPSGFIEFLRPKNDKPFNSHDAMCLEIIARFISLQSRNFMVPTPLEYNEKTLLESQYNFLGKQILTPKETVVLELVLKGYTNQEIANQLFISTNTVKKHLKSIFSKYGVTNRMN